jgi:hypothetical protein
LLRSRLSTIYSLASLAIAIGLGGTLQHPGTLHKSIRILFSLIALTFAASALVRPTETVNVREPKLGIPLRARDSLTGSQFAQYISQMSAQQREEAIQQEILKGNVPEFLRKLVPVELHSGSPAGNTLTVTIFVAPDYLAIGSDADFLRIPMNLHTALAIADHFGFVLPTKKMVDAIYLQSHYHLAPQPLPAGPQMTSTAYYLSHNQMIEKQADSVGLRLGELVAGDKKDVVMTNLLSRRMGRIAIYGWHRGPGQPIQPLSTVHGADYADYSHGIRVVSGTALIGGKPRSIYDILQDPSAAKIVSDEGSIRAFGELFSSHRQ